MAKRSGKVKVVDGVRIEPGIPVPPKMTGKGRKPKVVSSLKKHPQFAVARTGDSFFLPVPKGLSVIKFQSRISAYIDYARRRLRADDGVVTEWATRRLTESERVGLRIWCVSRKTAGPGRPSPRFASRSSGGKALLEAARPTNGRGPLPEVMPDDELTEMLQD